MNELKLKSRIIKVSAVIGFTFLSVTTFASTNGNENELATQRTIKQHISFPNIILPIAKSEKVEVVFTTAENGKVNFILVKTQIEIIKKQIEKQFSEMTLPKIKSNVAYSIVFNIKKI